jgi:hypothetical protein
MARKTTTRKAAAKPATKAPTKPAAITTPAAAKIVKAHTATAMDPPINGGRIGPKRNQASGAIIAALDNRKGQVKDGLAAWLVVCLEHGTILPVDTVTAASAARASAPTWCPGCKAAAAAKARAAKAPAKAKTNGRKAVVTTAMSAGDVRDAIAAIGQ